jgi:hypothetical protein
LYKIFETEALHLIEKLEELIETMPNMGDTCEDSQKVCLVAALYKLEQTVNGVSTDDFNDVVKESKFDKVLKFEKYFENNAGQDVFEGEHTIEFEWKSMDGTEIIDDDKEELSNEALYQALVDIR